MYIVLCFGYKTWGYLNNIMAEFFRFETIKLGASFLCEDNFDSKSGAQRATYAAGDVTPATMQLKWVCSDIGYPPQAGVEEAEVNHLGGTVHGACETVPELCRVTAGDEVWSS